MSERLLEVGAVGREDEVKIDAYNRMLKLIDAAEARGVDVTVLRRDLINKDQLSEDYQMSVFSMRAGDPVLSAALAREYLQYGLSKGKDGIQAIHRFGEDLRRLAKLSEQDRANIVEHNKDYAKFFSDLAAAEAREMKA